MADPTSPDRRTRQLTLAPPLRLAETTFNAFESNEVKLGSIAVNADEYLSVHGLPLDKMALDQLLGDPEVVEWIAAMTKMGCSR